MKIKALVSFAGAISMYAGEEREYNDKTVLSDLKKAGYIEEAKAEQEENSTEKVEESSKKGVKNENKRNNGK